MLQQLTLSLPAWLSGYPAAQPLPADDAGRVAEVLALASENVRRGTGGPFAAAVYHEATGARLAVAVNAVLPNRCALAHAETLALGLAQQAAGTHTLAGIPALLVSSSEPCAMCLGAIAWSGIARLVYASTRGDVESLGFDEGPRTARWKQALAQRGVQVRGPLLRQEGRAVLDLYAQRGGAIYNAGGGSKRDS